MQLARGSLCVSSRKGQTSDCAWVPGKAHPLFYNAAITITTITITEGWDQINNNSDCFEIGWSFANDIRWYFMVFRWVQSLNLIHTDNHKYEQKCACAQSHWMHNNVVYMHVHSTNCCSQGHWFGPIYDTCMYLSTLNWKYAETLFSVRRI